MVIEFRIVATLVEVLLIGKSMKESSRLLEMFTSYWTTVKQVYSGIKIHQAVHLIYLTSYNVCYTSMTKCFISYNYQEIVSILEL